MPDNLPELRDIHLPEAVSAFPPGYGWWIILAAAIVLIASFYSIKKILAKSKKLFALRQLKQIATGAVIDDAIKVSELLRRICVYKYKSAAALNGSEWLLFLQSKSKHKLSGSPAELLLNAPYLSRTSKTFSEEDLVNIKEFTKDWIGENL